MSEISILIVKEATQARTHLALGAQTRLPESLVWGADSIDELESNCVASETWPTDQHILNATVIDKDKRRITIAGGSLFCVMPYQAVLLDRLIQQAWPAYSIEHIPLLGEAIADAAEIAMPPVDPALPRKIISETFGELDDEEDDVDPVRHERRLLEAAREVEDQDWWISLRRENETRFQHYEADYVLKALRESGTEFIHQLTQVPESDPPDESECGRGIVIDESTRTLVHWSYPRGVATWSDLNHDWSDWNIQTWMVDGFRRQLSTTGELERSVLKTDLSHLSEFVPVIVERFDMESLVGAFRSGVRGMVRKGFGCLAVVLAIPAALVWAISGVWKGPFVVAAGFWLLAYVGYRVMASKMKRQMEPIVQQQSKMQNINPKIGLEEESDRVAHIDRLLKAAGLPSYQQITEYDEFDGGDDEHIGPIVEIEEHQ